MYAKSAKYYMIVCKSKRSLRTLRDIWFYIRAMYTKSAKYYPLMSYSLCVIFYFIMIPVPILPVLAPSRRAE